MKGFVSLGQRTLYVIKKIIRTEVTQDSRQVQEQASQ